VERLNTPYQKFSVENGQATPMWHLDNLLIIKHIHASTTTRQDYQINKT
jgi:hypothetical protein